MAVGETLPQGAIEDVFDEALAELEAGHSDNAQRLFEIVVARAPDSDAAAAARNHLGELYRRPQLAKPIEAPSEEAAVDSSPRHTRLAAPERTRLTPPMGIGAPDPVQAARAERLQEQLIAEAGDRIFFSAGSSEIGTRARNVLAAQARFIKLRGDVVATIEGHADDGPLSAAQHDALAQARAEAVRARLVAEGVTDGRLSVLSLGRSQRVSDCPDAACAAQNRRVVTHLQLIDGGGPPASPLAQSEPVPTH